MPPTLHPQLDTASNDLDWLARWYRHHCNGSWEHALGLRLERYTRPPRHTSGHPCSAHEGWRLTIELAGTDSCDHHPRTLLLDSIDGGWLSCSLTRERFVGTGDHAKVEQIIAVFRRWIEQPQPSALELVAALKS